MAATAARSEAADLELRRLTRVMHDTAVNTLGAVHRWPQQDRDALARRCAADLAILTRAQHREIRRPEDLVASVASRAELLGVDLAVDSGGWGPDLDPGVAAVVGGRGVGGAEQRGQALRPAARLACSGPGTGATVSWWWTIPAADSPQDGIGTPGAGWTR